MIYIRNTQRKISINIDELRKVVKKMLIKLEYSNFDISIWLTTNATIRKYNKIYRHKDEPTDILSFPYHTSLQPGKRISTLTQEDKNLGDLIISLEQAQKDARKNDHTFKEHLVMLLAHGIAHLLGYRHETNAEYAAMQKVEKSLQKTAKV
jgi:rRNA maturation RNase YbeY